MLGWGLADFFAKKTIDEIGDVATLAWAHVFGTGTLLIIALYQLITHQQFIHVPSDIQTWLGLLFFGILQAIVYLLVYKGFGKGQIALLSPIFASFSGFTAAISILVFGEMVSGYVFLGLATLFIGILMINLDPQALRTKRLSFLRIPGFKEIAGATVFAIMWTLLWDKFVGGKDWLSYALFMYAFMTLAILLVAKFRGINLLGVKPHIWKFLALIGICEVVAYTAISWGYGTTSMTSIVALLSGAFSLPTIFLARVFLKEKITPLQITGGLIVIAGIMILSIP